MATEMGGAEEQLVVFDVAGECYGVDISRVNSIIRMQKITESPERVFLEGVINLRGKVIPVVDLRKRFDLPIQDHTKASRIVVVEYGEETLGMIVNGVSEVLRVASSSIEPPSPLVTTIDSTYLRGIAKVEDRLIILLDLEQILTEEQMQHLTDVQAAKSAA